MYFIFLNLEISGRSLGDFGLVIRCVSSLILTLMEVKSATLDMVSLILMLMSVKSATLDMFKNKINYIEMYRLGKTGASMFQ
jgi:hypothetical protein